MTPLDARAHMLRSIDAAKRWPCDASLTVEALPDPASLEREVFAALSPQSTLPETADAIGDEEQWITIAGDGVLEEKQWVWMVGADERWLYHLLVRDAAYVVTVLNVYDHHTPPTPEPYAFEVRARSAEDLARVMRTLRDALARHGAREIDARPGA